jgi:hypothetical protein
MELVQALQIVDALANGRHPLTGQPLAADHVCQQPQVVRALGLIIQHLRHLNPADPRAGTSLKVESGVLPVEAPDSPPPQIVPLSESMLKRLRVWGAAVRDREGEHANCQPETARLGKTLCDLISLREAFRADVAGDDGPIVMMVGLLVLSGVQWR